jgi:hypothetical protein
LYDRSDLRGYTAKQLHDIQNGRLTIPTKKSGAFALGSGYAAGSKTIQKNTSMKLTQKQVNNSSRAKALARILIMGL